MVIISVFSVYQVKVGPGHKITLKMTATVLAGCLANQLSGLLTKTIYHFVLTRFVLMNHKVETGWPNQLGILSLWPYLSTIKSSHLKIDEPEPDNYRTTLHYTLLPPQTSRQWNIDKQLSIALLYYWRYLFKYLGNFSQFFYSWHYQFHFLITCSMRADTWVRE